MQVFTNISPWLFWDTEQNRMLTVKAYVLTTVACFQYNVWQHSVLFINQIVVKDWTETMFVWALEQIFMICIILL